MWYGILSVLLVVAAIFLILLVLVQRGRGGGLAGALGGMGGQSAFGTKAGDLFTKITMWSAAVWIGLCILSVKVLSKPSESKFTGGSETQSSQPFEKTDAAPPPATPPAPAKSDGGKPDDGGKK
jgi:preprotein translocase subunit SecG